MNSSKKYCLCIQKVSFLLGFLISSVRIAINVETSFYKVFYSIEPVFTLSQT